ncbi:MAG: glycoside hydrolase family 5 protein, partial [Calditrichaeota bacterium]|nr:glycoside hydrolase family 5 protein [Calditrichota bacterium]
MNSENFIKKRVAKTAVLLVLTTVAGWLQTSVLAQPTFFNLTRWFQKPAASRIQLNQFTPEDFHHIVELGCDHIRLPINLLAFADDQGNPDTVFVRLLDQVIDWAEEAGLVIIVDNHTFDPRVSTNPAIKNKLVATWRNLAAHLRSRSQNVVFEILNEPHGIADPTWASIQQEAIQAIRSVDTVHTIVVTPANWAHIENLYRLPSYADSNLVYTFHFYDPFLFTHQGASWTNPPMTDLAGVPFPYDQSRMPDLPASLVGTWVQRIYNEYPQHGNADWVRQRLQKAVAFAEMRNVRVWCGEFGAYIPNSTTEDRARWLRVVRTFLEENNVPWTLWEYSGGFGIFEPGSDERFESDLNVPILEALGLNVPPQHEPAREPDTTGFRIYDDGIAPGLIEDSWAPGAEIDLHWTESPHSGTACLHFAHPETYNYLGLRFSPVRNLSLLVEKGYALEMWVRCNQPDAKIHVRFVDTKTGPDDHPWRVRVVLGPPEFRWSGDWEYVRIPLRDFKEYGSWDNGRWYNPEGLFDWTEIEYLHILADYSDLSSVSVDLDDIAVVGPNSAVSFRTGGTRPECFRLEPGYPNPVEPGRNVIFPFNLPHGGRVKLTVFDVRGRKIFETSRLYRATGPHR